MRNIGILLFCLLLAGCATTQTTSHTETILPDESDGLGGTGIESIDIRTVGRKMAESLIGIPEIAQAQGIPRIGLLLVKNSTRFVIDKDIFTKKIRLELNKNANGQVRFLERERLEDIIKEREAKREGLFTSSKEGDLLGVDFYLTGELIGLSKASKGHRSDYFLLSFQLIDAETSDIV